MHPMTVELLSKVEKHNRSKQAEVLQLRNRTRPARPSQLPLFKGVGNYLTAALMVATRRLAEWKARSLIRDSA